MIKENTTSRIHSLEEERELVSKKFQKYKPWMILVPVLIFMSSFLLFQNAAGSLALSSFSFIFSFLFYYFSIQRPFNKLKIDVRRNLIGEFMNEYHPLVEYTYHPSKKRIKSIVRETKILTANSYKEEDVLEGKLENVHFYISEALLRQSTGKSTHTVFKGIVMEITFLDKIFPTSTIKAKSNAVERFFSGLTRYKNYNFYYKTAHEDDFEELLNPLFPFISHLITQYKELKIKTKGNKVTLFLDTDMEFMDTPKPRFNKTFHNKEYYNNLGAQLNSLLFIIESFANNLETTEIEERLELKMIEWEKISREK